MEEIWKDILNYEGYYQVSNLGNIRSLDREITRSDGVKQIRRGAIMARRYNDDGYPIAKLSKNGKSKSIAIHILVARAFIPNPNNLSDVNHKDFDRDNAAAENLEWISHGDNVRYSINAGRHFCNKDLFGENNPNYQNTTLKQYYADHPEEKYKLSRKGAVNGRAVPVEMLDIDGGSYTFGYLRECAQYLLDNNYAHAKTVGIIADKISAAIKNKTSYCGCYFNKI